ncbi:endonuclease/exonuclease/phosphatase family protein [Aliifodinibius sp. S!AR15-10]|uniref:endonuclease/exonuclease/phosphatase family protein n=1 Tax=Aliifodinibius sp. S!AR15-10 TaxID=2950437 RepID=UPI002861C22D|nr:endonuclease/exonuclease/phosphatase family protein [Aliifodinibius sp. S!AR15-10]MDR8392795.1 endonuclease/exonuclease/phosphatase family protein [Aliifodinibius sp. S!AR15-10]
MKISSIFIGAIRVLLAFLLVMVINSIANAQDTLRVMTYNIYHGEDPRQPGRSNLEEIASLIQKVKPDLVALQEVDSLTGRSASLNYGVPQNLIHELAEMTGMQGYFGKAIDFDGGGYGEGILSRSPVNIQKVMLPIPKGGEKRAMLVAQTKVSKENTLLFAGTHLCHQFAENRLAQVQKINEVFRESAQPLILAGDLNFVPGSEPYRVLQNYWTDLAKRSKSADPTYSYKNPSRRIDYLFLSKRSLEQVKVAEVQVLNVGYSDHMPLVTTIVLH